MSKKDSEYLINRKDNQYEVVIGLEVHAQVYLNQNYFLLLQLNLERSLIHRLV